MNSSNTQNSVERGYRLWFLIDGVVTGANAAAYLVLSQVLPGLLGSTAVLYLTVGVVLALVTAGLLTVAWSKSRRGTLAVLLIFINFAWAAASLVSAVANPFGFTAIGVIWTVAQAIIVLGFGLLQVRALRAARVGQADALRITKV
ncbi:hypothetical protein HF576_05260 [Microbacterium sp. CFH 90308]|uniref:Integral membrane protein n=1 Tax=Microbacterium salsuginis TaxID=2722803 RepID=A0ABX1K8C4_9MICO|nr:hypothetical protein [Microbacterium sp. CFH 90308]NLP83247.1 hypothetical protein [Microbacterium sp. CFH 90308]